MDTFKMSMREIRKKYTKSELVVMAWDSKQKSYAMNQKYKHVKNRHSSDRSIPDPDTVSNNGVIEKADKYVLPEGVNGGVAIPKKFFNEEGDIDLRQVTGPEALNYLRAVGINIIPRF